jgi:hypothetical protein
MLAGEDSAGVTSGFSNCSFVCSVEGIVVFDEISSMCSAVGADAIISVGFSSIF